ncbi:MAG: DUF6036 family nucleotidyltransferase [Blastocatellia bacterium]
MPPPEPWLGFLKEIDEFLKEEQQFHCLGGFVVTQQYGSVRSTSDVDFLTLVQRNDALSEFAGFGSPLYQKYKVYLDPVGVAIIPDSYAERLTPMYPDCFARIRLWAMDPYDIILSKIERNSSRDREDVEYLARTLQLDLALLKDRYEREVRYQVKNERREDQTLNLWISMIEETRLGRMDR